MAKRIILLLFATALLVSCGGSSNGETTPPSVTPSATPTPESYTDLSNLYEARVASGFWSVEEGLVSMLRLIAGETELDGNFQEAEIISPSATGIILRAQNYLQTGTDAEAKAEITSLLSALVPSLETLEFFSTPAQEGGARAPGHSVQVDCRTLQGEGFPADSATPCFEVYDAAVGSYHIKIFFPEAWGEDEIRRQYLAATQDALVDSIRTYDGLGLEHRTLYAFFTLLDYSAGDNIYASADLPSGTRVIDASGANCLLAIYPHGTIIASRGADDYKQVLAHELFHCYEFWNYDSAAYGVPQTENDWWMEGAAEYFSNVVYPTANAEYEYIPNFDRRSQFSPITQLSYENFLFFQYLANLVGNPGVLRLLDSMPESAGASQADALAAFPDIEEIFHNFGRAYWDEQVEDTGGGFVPVNPRAVDVILFDSPFLDAIPPVERFVLRRFKLIFPEEQAYTLTMGHDGEGLHGAELFGRSGEWAELPAELEVGCGAREYVLLVTTTSPDEYHYQMDVNTAEGPGCDECLLGQWELDISTYEAFFTYEGLPPEVEYGGASGLLWANYGEDGIVRGGWTDFSSTSTLHMDMAGEPFDVVSVVEINGTSQVYYSARDNTLTYTDPIEVYTVTSTTNGVTSILDIAESGALSPFGGGTIMYTCTADTLRFTSDAFPRLNALIFLRAD